MMHLLTDVDPATLQDRLSQLAPEEGRVPDISVVVPVNAQGDLDNVLRLAGDVARYTGPHTLEVIVVVNNYQADTPPAAIKAYRAMGMVVVAIPSVRRPGEAVGFSARIPGVRAARSECVVLFDADCRVGDPTALLDWYAGTLHGGAVAAYSRVNYYDYEDCASIRARFLIHHASRWIKRNVFRIPTTRGSNYGVQRPVMLELYDRGLLADEMNVGPTFRKLKGRVAYSGRRRHVVHTSGRMFPRGWLRILPYLTYRLKYNVRVLPVREGVARMTGREMDPVRRYIDNRPVRTNPSG
jgi:glycosyltransferase involved in cell wall biosynthesis